MIVKKLTKDKNPLATRKITKIKIDAGCDIGKILQPSDIGAVLPLNTCVILSIDGIKKYVNSTNIIDSFIEGEYDDYEVTCISSKDYGWLMIELATLED
jgi:hypothetical protein